MLNKVILQGNLTRDPELTYTKSGTVLAKFGLASNNKFGQREDTYFADCVAWSKTAEFVEEYFEKGSSVIVEGRLTLEQWEDKEGNKRSKTVVTVDRVHFAGGQKNKAASHDVEETEPEAELTNAGPFPF